MRTTARCAALALLLGVPLTAQVPVRVGVVAGVVVDTAGVPIDGAELVVRGTLARTRSDSAGAFRMSDVPVGPQLLEVRRLGAAQRVLPLTVVAGESSVLEIVLVASARQLPAIAVEAERPQALVGMIGGADFTARRRAGMGTFFSRARIDSLRPRRAYDLFRMAQGLGLRYLPDNRVSIVTKRGVMGVVSQCEVALYLDGVRVPHDVLTELAVEHIEAIEAYAGPASTPLVFGGTQSSCGAAAIWLRRR